MTTHEGDSFDDRMVLIEFSDLTAAEACYNALEYQDSSKFRRASSKGRMYLQERVSNTAAPDRKKRML